MKKNFVLVINFEDHVGHLAARKVRDAGVYSELLSPSLAEEYLRSNFPKGIISAGYSRSNLEIKKWIETLNIPTLNFNDDKSISSEELKLFLKDSCGCEMNWSPENFVADAIDRIKKMVGNKKVVCGLSGGVDSAVTAALVHKAIGKNLTCIFVDTGLMRLKEGQEIVREFKRNLDLDLKVVLAEDRFLTELKGVEDPEKKRKIIGSLFIDIFKDEAMKINDVEFLAQGTLYTDIVESISSNGSVAVKSHHNVGGLPEKLGFKLLEPLKELFKDEVREIGKYLGLSDDLLYRHPFPGPGLAVRVIGEVTKEKCDLLRKVDWIAIQELKESGLYHNIWQAFCILTPIKSVGVKDGKRVYGYIVALRAVKGLDGMTAEWYPLPYEVLNRISEKIMYTVKEISRVVYDISSKPPATIEWE